MTDTPKTADQQAYEQLLGEFPLPPLNQRRIFFNNTEEQIIRLLGGDPKVAKQPDIVLDRLQDSIDHAETDLEREEFSWLMEKLEEASLQ